MERRVLVVEDDARIARLVHIHLKDLGLTPVWKTDGRSGLEEALSGPYALVVLDLMLPELDGLEVCKRLRSAGSKMPVLMLTAKSDEIDVVLGLELGADEYITKPFSVREFIARVKALLRRTESEREPSPPDRDVPLVFGPLTIDRTRRKVTLRDQTVTLTAKEFDLLFHFASAPGKVFSRSELLEQVWGYRFEGYDHTVNSLINRLRRKIEDDPSHPRYIRTIWGVGYRFAESDELDP